MILTSKQIQVLHDAFCGGEKDEEILLQEGDGHSGPGLYASCSDYPDEGSIFLEV